MYIIIKQVIDFFIALILLIPTLIIVLISAIFIKLEDKGPVFYMASRSGLRGKPFRMYKLRTMIVDAPDIRTEDGSTFNSESDPRVTKFGKFARKTSIDELPQILNVLKGDMSFVGPRPDSASYLNQYTDEEKIILTVRPGITGYNQAINRNAVGTKEKLKNDIYYVNNMSFVFDCKIIVWTIKSVLSHKDVYRGEVSKDRKE
ncbi:sugar transferase [Streptococcus zalophi]|uniref:Sugar transferase n=1 Tax=Streptococcus zalophi TaxID=640031 RepID=A0A934P916_9STRE|nr:sugar transferase [Streptococcus zalophi]MBJ8349331.1 sugar transferase [Streptococcus zalophi]